MCKKSSHINNMHTNNFHENHCTNIMTINILQPLISAKQKYMITARVPQLLLKNFLIMKKEICLVNIMMINLSFHELRLIAQLRNISDYENKYKEDLIKALSEAKPEAPKPEAPKPEPKPEIRVNKREFKKLRKDFDELRHKFFKKEIDRYRKAFYNDKNYKTFSISEIKEASKSLTKFKKRLRFKKFRGNIDSINYDDLDNYDYNYDFAADDKHRKIGSISYLKSLIVIITNQ